MTFLDPSKLTSKSNFSFRKLRQVGSSKINSGLASQTQTRLWLTPQVWLMLHMSQIKYEESSMYLETSYYIKFASYGHCELS